MSIHPATVPLFQMAGSGDPQAMLGFTLNSKE